jgi:alkylated DNA repair dioxygenase AlkB
MSPPLQADLFGSPPPALPEGLVYQPELVSPAEEAELAARFEALPFAPFQFHGFEANRRVIYFGWRYDYAQGALHAAEPMPDWLHPLRERAEAFAGVASGSIVHVLINQYLPGAGIGWHRDRPQFEDVIGVSLLAPCRFRMRRRSADGGWERTAFIAEPRSAYLLRGPSRTDWEHSIAPMEALRYSITFRTLRAQEKRRTPS